MRQPTSCVSSRGCRKAANRNVSSRFWRLESKTQVLAGLVPPEASLFGLWTAIFFLCPYLVFPLCTDICVLTSSLGRTGIVLD